MRRQKKKQKQMTFPIDFLLIIFIYIRPTFRVDKSDTNKGSEETENVLLSQINISTNHSGLELTSASTYPELQFL